MLKKTDKQKTIYAVLSLLSLGAMWLVWVIAYYGVGNPLIVPSFSEAFSSFWGYLGDGDFWLALLNSLLRTFLAFTVSFAIAVLFCVLSLFGGGVKAFLKPITVFVRTLPTMAVILVIFKLTNGNKTLSPVIVTVLVLFPMIFSQLTAAVQGIDAGVKNMAEVYGIGKKDRLFKIYLPLISPSVFSQTGANISLGLKIMISSEVLVNTARGLGGMMQNSSGVGDAAALAALTLAAVAAGLAIEFSFSFLKKINGRWYVGD